ncbi:MAG: hypothetical protein BGN96_12705 [Bacteroidales bacterium 45-6]|nr:MAG: hypothetical protein BGN96_12705 [Bacteroidales bacterium 45-6]
MTGLALSSLSSGQNLKYPQTAKVDSADTYFGVQVKEPYRWLENDKSPQTEAWVKAQNAVTYAYLDKIPFREGLKKRLTELMNYPKYGSPSKKNGVYYFYKNDGLQNQSVLYRQASLTAEPEILLDPNTLSKDGTVALSSIAFSNDGKYLAYSVARAGSDWNEIYVMDLATKKLLADHILWVKFSGISWQGDGFYYSAYDAPQPGKELSKINEYHKVFFHKVGDSQKDDKIVFQNKDFPLRNVGAAVTEDEKFLIISETESTSGNTFQFKDLTKASSSLISLVADFENDYNVVDDFNGKLYVLTNWKAPKQRLMEIDPENPQRENWKEIIPETNDVLESVSLIGGKFLAVYMKDAANHAYAFDISGKKLYEAIFFVCIEFFFSYNLW